MLKYRLPMFGLKIASELIVEDQHSSFRLLAKLIFGSQHEYMLMRECLACQVDYHSVIYSRLLFDGNMHKLRQFRNGVAVDQFINDRICMQIACDLFDITIWIVTDYSLNPILEVRPGILEAGDLLVRERDLLLEKGVYWIVDSEDYALQPLVPVRPTNGFFVPYAPEFEDLELLRNTVHRRDALLHLCRSFVENQFGTPLSRSIVGRHQYRFSELGYRLIKIIGDGNCVIRALSYWILGCQHKYKLLRALIVVVLKKNPSRYEKYRVVKVKADKKLETYSEYCDRMSEDGQWGDTACIQTMLDLFHLKLNVVESMSQLVMRELYPEDDYYHAEIHCAVTPLHMDVIVPEVWSPLYISDDPHLVYC